MDELVSWLKSAGWTVFYKQDRLGCGAIWCRGNVWGTHVCRYCGCFMWTSL